MNGLVASASALGVLMAAPAVATPTVHHKTHSSPAASAKARMDQLTPANMEAIAAFIEKLFPQEGDPDPARMAQARRAVDAMWPNGTYGKMMNGMIAGLAERAMTLKLSDLQALSGKETGPPSDASQGPSLHDLAAGSDPYFDKRLQAIRQAVQEELGKVSAIIDPRIRDGLAKSMARRFDQQQLADIDIFFATPSGQAFAGEYLRLWMTPDTMREILHSMPEMAKLMPEAMAKVKAASDKFPKPPKASGSAQP